MSKQLEKKKKIFEDSKKSAIKRLRALHDYLDLLEDDNERTMLFYREYEGVFSLISRALHPPVNQSKKKKQKPISLSDERIVFDVFEMFMVHNKDTLKNKWKQPEIIEILRITCSTRNRVSARRRGITIMCSYIDVLQESIDKSIATLFQNVLDFSAFVGDFSTQVKLATRPIDTPVFGIGEKDQVGNTKEELLTNLEYVLKFVTETTNNRPFWIRFLVTTLFPSLYPRICVEAGVVELDDGNGFREHCPYEIQVLITQYTLKWMSTAKGSQSDYASRVSGSFTRSLSLSSTTFVETLLFDKFRDIFLGVLGQSFTLPFSYQKTLNDVISIYKDWIEYKKTRPPSIRREFNVFMVSFLRHVKSSFLNIPADDNYFKYVSRFKGLIHFVEIIISEKQDFLPTRYWNLLIDFSTEVLIALATNLPGEIKQGVFPHFLGLSFSIWINSRTTNRAVWRKIHDTVKVLREDMVLAVQWKRALTFLTVQQHQHLFNSDGKFLTLKEEMELSPPNKIPERYWTDNTRNSPTFAIRANHKLLPDFKSIERGVPSIHIKSRFFTQESALYVWSRFFRLFGNPNNIEDPQVYSYVISAYIEIFYLTKILEEDLFKKAEIDEQQFFPHMNLFMPIFFEGALRVDKYKAGRALCYGILCQVLSRKRRNPLSGEMLSRFYYTLTVGLMYKDFSVTTNIIRYTSQFFGYACPGSNGLIGPYLKAIRDLFQEPGNKYLTPDVYVHAITLLSQFVSVQDHLEGMEVYDYSKLLSVNPQNVDDFIQVHDVFGMEIENRERAGISIMNAIESQVEFGMIVDFVKKEYQRQQTAMDKDSVDKLNELYLLDLGSVRSTIVDIVAKYLFKARPSDSNIIKYSIWLLTSTLLLELGRENTEDSAMVSTVLEALFAYISHSDADISSVASASLSTISKRRNIYNVNRTACEDLIKNSTNFVIDQITFSVEKRERPPENLHFIVNFLSRWCVNISKIFENKRFIENVLYMLFTIFDMVVLKSDGNNSEVVSLEALPLSAKGKKRGSKQVVDIRTVGELFSRTKRIYRDFELENIGKDVEYVAPPYTHPCLELMNSSEILYYYINTIVNNYPRFGDRHDHISSLFVDDSVDIPREYFKVVDGYQTGGEASDLPFEEYSRTYSMGDDTIITFYELVKPGPGRNPVIRIIVRDVSGKYVWDVEYLTERLSKEVSTAPSRSPGAHQVTGLRTDSNLQHRRRTARKKMEIPKYKPGCNMDGADLLNELLTYVGEAIEVGKRFNVPNVSDYSADEDLLATERVYEMIADAVSSGSPIDREKLALTVLRETAHSIPIHRVQYVRTFLTALGFIGPKTFTNIIPMKRLTKVSRALKQIDIRPAREIQKIGVLYLAPGQSTQNEILQNESSSALFEEFVDSLGWGVDINKHNGYSGGLDKITHRNGHTFPYYSEFDLEVAFHVVSRMPNSEKDSQQIHKKRHVGNDNIHIVWSEDDREYRKETITSRFNFAHIVIYPLPNGMFRIQILAKDGVRLFGPCISGMILDKKALGFMVRETAITANKSVRYTQKGYKHPFLSRWDIIYEAIERNRENLEYEEYFGDFFYLDEGEREKT